MDVQKSKGPDGMHSQVLREEADVFVRPFLIIFGRLWWLGEVPEGWRNFPGQVLILKMSC